MPIEEMLIEHMAMLIGEINNEGLKKKIDLSKNIIALLYVYMRQLGLSQNEITMLYSKEDSEDEA